MVTKIEIEPAYRKPNGGWNLDTEKLIKDIKFKVKERNIVYIPPDEVGGNHVHPRSEAFVGLGNKLYFVWKDKDGNRHKEKMMDGEKLYLFFVEPQTPHAVVNEDSSFAVLAEFADDSQHSVERTEVI